MKVEIVSFDDIRTVGGYYITKGKLYKSHEELKQDHPESGYRDCFQIMVYTREIDIAKTDYNTDEEYTLTVNRIENTRDKIVETVKRITGIEFIFVKPKFEIDGNKRWFPIREE